MAKKLNGQEALHQLLDEQNDELDILLKDATFGRVLDRAAKVSAVIAITLLVVGYPLAAALSAAFSVVTGVMAIRKMLSIKRRLMKSMETVIEGVEAYSRSKEKQGRE